MNRKIFAALALSTVFPIAALAQSTTAPVTPEQGQMTNQNKARGGMPDSPRMNEPTTAGPFITVHGQGAWRVSDLEGKPVYTVGGEDIGDINDVLVSQDGSVNAVLIGVGGFLGIGEKDVAVNMSALQLGPGMTQQQANRAAKNSVAVSGETTASTRNTSNPVPSANTKNGVGMGAQQQNTAAARNTGTQQPADNQMASSATSSEPDAAEIGKDGLPQRIVLNVTREQLQQAPAFRGMTPAR